ncbi:MAG TPA: Gfo/Idh/MocA family oxidoreductase, partial [Thermomicrobiales bacterium]|nr:Gfo/Idh/MocA family oxidoreductase [Thermomicrobiales bacterium]
MFKETNVEPVRMAIVGCGGMGRRHLAGLAELHRVGDRSIDLIAVCDRNEQNANDLADEAALAFGSRPLVHASVADMVAGSPTLEAADCTTDTGSHHIVATELLTAGLATLVEKPIALTIRGGHQVAAAAAKSGAILSVAENYRRDPMNRLIHALLQDGAIGDPHLLVETSIGGRDTILITPWRHQKLTGTITLDAGVHNADMLSYFFGDVATVYGQTRLHHPTRVRRETAGPGGYYEKWAAGMPESITATGEDALDGLLTFANGRVAHWIQNHAGHGESVRQRMIFGSRGSITAPDDRSGQPIRIVLDDGTVHEGEAVLDLAPSYRLEPIAAQLFGS